MTPHSDAAERNKAPILAVLRRAFADASTVLEIGSGTGQHAVHFAGALPHLIWQPSEMPGQLGGLRRRIEEAALPNLASPVGLDVTDRPWPIGRADAVFSANTAHIMAWSEVERMLEGVGEALAGGGVFCLYGPFRSSGEFDTESNRRFDALLRSQDPDMGVRDREALVESAGAHGLVLAGEHPMPANNRLLEWRKAAPL